MRLGNWCFWTVVLEKTLESPLDCKEIQPVHSEGDQSWVFIGKTEAEAETPVLWLPHGKSWLIGKDSDAGRDWGQEEETTEDEMAGWHHSMDVSLSELWELVMLSNHLILCQLLLLLPSVFPSIRVFSNKLAFCTRWPKYLSFTFSISPSNEYSGLISLGLRGLISLLPKQGTLKSLLQDYSSEASILWCSAFFMVWLTSVHDSWIYSNITDS